MSRRRRAKEADSRRPQPVQVVIEAEGAQPPESMPGRRPDRAAVFAVILVLIGLVGVGLLVRSDDDPLPDDPSPDDPPPEDAVMPTSEVAGPDGLGDLTISVSVIDGAVVVEATSSTGTAPWVAFELCADDPAGCVPLWTTSLDQDGASYEARLRVPDGFVSPGGHEHDCRNGEGCVLWVTTGDRSSPFELPTDSEPPTSTTVGGRSPSIVISPPVGDDGQIRSVQLGADPGDSYTVAVCAAPIEASCTTVREGTVDGDGRASLELALSRTVPFRTGRSEWPLVDCAVTRCWLGVETSGGSTAVGLDFTTAPAVSSAAVTIEGGGAVDVGAPVEISGSGFRRVEASTAGRIRWVLCGERPASLDDIAISCATPRTTRAPTIGPDGDFSLAMSAPDPAVLRTWAGRVPLSCEDQCWFVFLAEPFPEVVAAPIVIRPVAG